MAKNNHFERSFSELNSLLREQAVTVRDSQSREVADFARGMAAVSGAVVVVSDLAGESSMIFPGAFAAELGIEDYCCENSIWEKRILNLMTLPEQEAKIIAELRFFHHVRRMGKRRSRYFLMSKLRFNLACGRTQDVLHRMYYIYGANGAEVRYAVCVYEPLAVDFKGRSVVVDMMTGVREELDAGSDANIISARERQVLALIDGGLTSKEIAARLNISLHTVSRHRQEILAKLQVKSSIEACRMARSMELI